MKVDIETLKISLIIIIFFSGIFGVLSPRLFKPFGSRLSYASLLSSGVLLAASLVHLLGDAADGLESSPLPKTSDGDAFPWAYFLCGTSFYFLYFFERFVIHALAHHDHDHTSNTPSKSQPANLNSNLLGAKQLSANDSPIVNSTNITPVLSHLPSPNPISRLSPHSIQSNNVQPAINDDMDEHGAEIFQLLVQKNYLTGIVLLIGLGLHSFLAGVALGSSTAENQAIALGIAIISHKYLAAFALGVPLYKSEINLCFNIGIALLFGCLTPLGIGLGWILSKSFDGWVGDCFISVAAGTFIYVSVCEVLIPEFSQQKKKEKITYRIEESRRELSRSNTSVLVQAQKLKALKLQMKMEEKRKANRQEILKCFSVIIGFILMSMLAFWV
eukprot:453661_1